MSLIVTVCTNEGIVMASDSRITYNNKITLEKGVHFSDTAYKTFLCGDKIGISSCGEADINGKPIAGFIERFIKNKYSEEQDVGNVAKNLLEYFKVLAPQRSIHFLVSGYTRENEEDHAVVFQVLLESEKIIESVHGLCDAFIDGENEIIFRLFKHGYLVDANNCAFLQNLNITNDDGSVGTYTNVTALVNNYLEIPQANIAWNLLTLQDAVDFARYAIQTTIETMRFEQRAKTVGGPIDILIIKPTGASFLNRKALK